MKIYLSPSNQPNNRYAYGGTNEKEQMERLARLVQAHLANYNCEPILATLSLHYSQRDEEAQARRADLYIALHSDAGPVSAVGATAFYTPDTEALGNLIVANLNQVTPFKSNRSDQTKDGVQAGFGEIWGPKAKGIPTILVETNFHTNREVAKWMIENMYVIAHAYVLAIAKQYNLTPKSQPAATTTTAPAGSFFIKVIVSELNIRSTPKVAPNNIVGSIKKDNKKYTIVEVKNGWGKLKSGAGWINISDKYVTRG